MRSTQITSAKLRLIKYLFFLIAFTSLMASCEFILPNKPPYAELTSPEDQTVYALGAVIPIIINAYDNDGTLTRVLFYLNDVMVNTDLTDPYEFSWNTNEYGPGDFILKIQAFDNDEEHYIINYPFSVIGQITSSAGLDVTIRTSDLTNTMQANTPSYGSGTWSVIQGAGGSFSDVNNPNAVFEGQDCTSYTLRWTVAHGGVSDTDDVNVTFYHTPSEADAGDDQMFNDGVVSASLDANTPDEGFGRWNIVSGGNGKFENNLDPNTVFTGLPCTNYVLSWTILTNCANTTDQVSINFNQVLVESHAGSDQSYIDGRISTTLHGIDPGTNDATWSILSGTGGVFSDVNDPNAVFYGVVCQSYELRWSIVSGCGLSEDEVIIEFAHIATTPSAGDDQIYDDGRNSAILNGNAPSQGDGLWTISSGAAGVFDDASDPVTKFTGDLCEAYILKWTISTTCGSIEDEVLIEFRHIPTVADAGMDIKVTNGVAQTPLAANTPVIGVGTWTVISGTNGSFADENDPQTVFTGALCGSYVLEWKITTLCASSADQVGVVFDQVTIPAFAGPDQGFFDGTVSTNLNANDPQSSMGTWRILSGSGGVFSDVNDHTATFTGVLGEVYNLEWAVSSACGFSTDLVRVAFLQSGTFNDVRDGSGYPIITVGNQVWMAKNLNYHLVNGSYEYVEGTGHRNTYGLLYEYSTALIACPAGYHLPTDPEWRELEMKLGLSSEASLLLGYRGGDEGGVLKESGNSHWHNPNAGATDLIGFTALPGGYRDKQGSSALMGGLATFWTATEDVQLDKALYRAMSKDKVQIGRQWFDVNNAISVRCVKDSQ
ncbi:MAG: hypothetical protein HOC82_21530 [Bacteroidetes bacterium]|nr:hypothetical protein [Bacteroidota bacterium]